MAAGTVLVGVALAWREGPWRADAPLLLAGALAAALLMQLITNLQNDVGFFLRGGDALPGRLGLPRATSRGWLSVGQVRAAIAACAALALALGVLLAWRRGWPVLAVGGLSLAAALAYMGGPRPLAYTRWGEVVAALFFGPVGVLGTQWLLSSRITALGLACSALPGLLAGVALGMNNARDEAHDRRLARRTLAVHLGLPRMRRLLLGCGVLAWCVPGGVALGTGIWPLPWLLTPWLWTLARGVQRAVDGPRWNALLQRLFALQCLSAGLLALALLRP